MCRQLIKSGKRKRKLRYWKLVGKFYRNIGNSRAEKSAKDGNGGKFDNEDENKDKEWKIRYSGIGTVQEEANVVSIALAYAGEALFVSEENPVSTNSPQGSPGKKSKSLPPSCLIKDKHLIIHPLWLLNPQNNHPIMRTNKPLMQLQQLHPQLRCQLTSSTPARRVSLHRH